MTHVILFYNKNEPYYEFTNFYPAPFELDEQTWPTSEHYFQTQKYYNPRSPRSMEYMKIVQQADTPSKIFRLANHQISTGHENWVVNKTTLPIPMNQVIAQYSDIRIRSDWEQVKRNVMYRALVAKFTQNPALQRLLISTGNAQLVENSPRDSYWGIGANGQGLNWLGRLLMDLRTRLRQN
jgi:hypothetical protein|uniref:NADAR domain-containing protein n=1 Tax=viral metagenome TaxID=1070528 RepID=A0A6C0BIS6_9ZZZZ